MDSWKWHWIKNLMLFSNCGPCRSGYSPKGPGQVATVSNKTRRRQWGWFSANRQTALSAADLRDPGGASTSVPCIYIILVHSPAIRRCPGCQKIHKSTNSTYNLAPFIFHCQHPSHRHLGLGQGEIACAKPLQTAVLQNGVGWCSSKLS